MEARKHRQANRRMAALAGLIPRGSRVADVGTDHARLPLLLLAAGRARHCIATETTPARIASLRRRLSSRALPEGLDLRAGNGLEPLRAGDGLDVLVLAGMGAATIRSILRRADLERLGMRRVVLQPQTEPASVRRHLHELGMRIVAEILLQRGRGFHLVLAAETGHRPILDPHPTLAPDDLMEAGPCLARSPDPAVRLYWEGQLRRNRRILEKAAAGHSMAEARRMRDLAARVLDALPGR